MKGIQFVIDGQGKKKAVLIDLEEWGDSWEDIYDVLVARSRQDGPTVDWEELKATSTSESSLKKDWLRPEEDEAWQDL